MSEQHSRSEGQGPAAVLRSIRATKGWTLAEVSNRTGFPVSTLSKLETGKMGLSYDKLMKLSQGLGIDVASFFGSPEQEDPGAQRVVSGRRTITRNGEGKTVETHAYSYNIHAADLLNRGLHPMFMEITARSMEEFGELSRHEGEEFTWVIEGCVEFHSDLYAPARLNAGDSIYFDAGMGHAYVAVSPGPCRIFSICTSLPDV